MVNDKILTARENRREIIDIMSKSSDVVTVKANVPGWEKNIPHASAIVKYFARVIESCGAFDLKALSGADGITVFGRVKDGKEFKEKAVALEKTHALGRLIDIDVTLKGEQKSLSRKELRKCFLCENPAFVCGRNKTHTTAELLKFFTSKTEEFLSRFIAQIIEESMLAELNLENKFGLVTPTSNGSHKDLNYRIMQNAVSAVKIPLSQAFIIGLKAESASDMLKKLIPVGAICERKMAEQTLGANAYKGFIFVGGVVLAALGFAIKSGNDNQNLSQICAEICKEYIYPSNTFGDKAYKNGFGGIRENAKKGFPIVEKAQKYFGKLSLSEILTFIVGNIEDSVLFKRAGSLERYNYFKNLISSAPKDDETRAQITKLCIENNISIGGSADVLIATVMVNKIKQNFYF